jgi:hypothetical protein
MNYFIMDLLVLEWRSSGGRRRVVLWRSKLGTSGEIMWTNTEGEGREEKEKVVCGSHGGFQ